ncbi:MULTISPECIES: flavin reductase family protein [Bradyrhizobium]|uniref:flavin reductase family protein n=1 Tax=Bradyrhizobium TaxID=374 RepID=UPI00188D7F89|nr:MULTISPECIES: flavin reductase family protein [Bradyrhizobium]MCC8935105.1 flavin reductase family protein [Bradyrhizobium ivorense]QOZ25181.1 flavin reductase [Bradyrhizobium sp. CCBAU 51753]
MTAIDPRALRNACGQFGTGVTIITTHCEGRDHGMTANAFMSVSLDPPLVAISIAKSAKMLPNIQKTSRFAVSVLAEGMEDLAWHFAGKPKPDLCDVFERRNELPVIANAAAYFVNDLAHEIAAGDHTIFLGQVREMSVQHCRKPLLFFSGRFGGLADPHPAPAMLENAGYEFIW